jgi:hypothetical protein
MKMLRQLTATLSLLLAVVLISACAAESGLPLLPDRPDLHSLPDWPRADFYVPPAPDSGITDSGITDSGMTDGGGLDGAGPAKTPPCNASLPIAGTRFVKKGGGPLALYASPQAGTPLIAVPEGAAHPLEYRPAGDSGSYACVSYTSFTGHVLASQLALAPPTTGSNAGATCQAGMPSLGRRWAKAHAGQIPLHSATNGGGSVVAQIPEGKDQWMDYLAVTAPGWVCVEYKGKVGHVSALLLSTSAPATSSGSGGCPTYDWVGSCNNNTVHWCENGVEKSLACGSNSCGKNANGINICKSSGSSGGSTKLGQGAACDQSGRTCQQDRSSCQLASTNWLNSACQQGMVCCKQKVSSGGCQYTHTGTCKGNTVHWCQNGVDQQLTCSGTCGKDASGLYTCLPPSSAGSGCKYTAKGTCKGNTVHWCEGGVDKSLQCSGSCGLDKNGLNACLPASSGGGSTGTPCGPAADGRTCQRLSGCKDNKVYPWQTTCAWGYFCCLAK